MENSFSTLDTRALDSVDVSLFLGQDTKILVRACRVSLTGDLMIAIFRLKQPIGSNGPSWLSGLGLDWIELGSD